MAPHRRPVAKTLTLLGPSIIVRREIAPGPRERRLVDVDPHDAAGALLLGEEERQGAEPTPEIEHVLPGHPLVRERAR